MERVLFDIETSWETCIDNQPLSLLGQEGTIYLTEAYGKNRLFLPSLFLRCYASYVSGFDLYFQKLLEDLSFPFLIEPSQDWASLEEYIAAMLVVRVNLLAMKGEESCYLFQLFPYKKLPEKLQKLQLKLSYMEVNRDENQFSLTEKSGIKPQRNVKRFPGNLKQTINITSGCHALLPASGNPGFDIMAIFPLSSSNFERLILLFQVKLSKVGRILESDAATLVVDKAKQLQTCFEKDKVIDVCI